jgi:hypothetical protein
VISLPNEHSRRTRQNRPPSVQIVCTVARAKAVHPTALWPPLSDVVDPDALDTLVTRADDSPDGSASTDGLSSVSFHYHDFDVTVHADGRVALSPVC